MKEIKVGVATCGIAAGGMLVYDELKKEIKNKIIKPIPGLLKFPLLIDAKYFIIKLFLPLSFELYTRNTQFLPMTCLLFQALFSKRSK